MSETKIGCVQHDCDECKDLRAKLASAEPVAYRYLIEASDGETYTAFDDADVFGSHILRKEPLYTTPQPAPASAEPVDTSKLQEAYMFGQFADDFDYPLVKPIRKAIRDLLDIGPLYTTPQPAPDVQAAVAEALDEYKADIKRLVERLVVSTKRFS